MNNSNLNPDGIFSIAEGEGSPAILLHGLGASLAGWNTTSEAFIRAGYRIYLIDLPGHGLSQKPDQPEEYQVDHVYPKVARWFYEVPRQRPVILVGHSFGAYIAVRLAIDYPDRVGRLILVSPFFYFEQLLPLMRLTIKQSELTSRILQATPTWAIESAVTFVSSLNNHLPLPTIRQTATDFHRASTGILYTANSVEDIRPLAAQVDLPTLVIWGEKDLTLNPSSFSKLVDMFPNADGRAFEMCGHTPHQTWPDRFNRTIMEFLDET